MKIMREKHPPQNAIKPATEQQQNKYPLAMTMYHPALQIMNQSSILYRRGRRRWLEVGEHEYNRRMRARSRSGGGGDDGGCAVIIAIIFILALLKSC